MSRFNREHINNLYGYEAANKFLQRNIDLLDPKEQKKVDLGRALYAVMPQPDNAYDVVLDRVPKALEALQSGNVEPVKDLMKDSLKIEGGIRELVNYAPGIEGHHGSELAGSYYINHDLPMQDALYFNSALADAGINLGTVAEDMYGLSRPGHAVAHLNLQNNQIASFGSSKRTAANTIAENGNGDWVDRLGLWVPKAQEIQYNSQWAYDTPQEQELRRYAGELSGFGDLVTSLERDPNRRKDSTLNYANSSKQIIAGNPVWSAMFKSKRDMLYDIMPEPAIPMQEIVEGKRGPNKGVKQFKLVPDKAQSMDPVINMNREGVIEALIAMHIDPSLLL